MTASRPQLDCLTDETLVRFSDGAIDGDEFARVEVHLDQCAECRLLVCTTTRLATALTQTVNEGGEGASAGELRPGRYHPTGVLGRGGMGIVFRANDPNLKREVALKVVSVPGDDVQRKRATARLLLEAEALAKLSHPHIVSVYDVGTIGDDVFIAMELVHGPTLREWLSEGQPVARVLATFVSAGEGLAAAHDAGVVHRDFKPENVIVSDSKVKVVDFGLARIDSDHSPGPDPSVDGSSDATAEHPDFGRPDSAFMGTPRYMAPEQFAQLPTGERTDQYSFCVALAEALFGVLPRSAADSPRGPYSLPKNRSVPRRVRRAVVRGLAQDPNDRYPDMQALLGDLRPSRRIGLVRTGLVAAVVAAIAAIVATQVPAAADRNEGQLEGERDDRADQSESPRKLADVHAFLRDHVVGKRFYQPRQTYVIERGRVEGEDTEEEWVSNLLLRGNHLSWQRRRKVDHVNYTLDASGERRLPGHRVERNGVDRYVVSIRAGTDTIMGLSNPVSGAGWENSISLHLRDNELTITGKSATEFRTVRRSGVQPWKAVVFRFEERYVVDEIGGTTKTVTVRGFYYDRKSRTSAAEPYMTVVSALTGLDG